MRSRRDGAEPATEGSYGRRPSGHRLPDATRLGPVRLQVADLERSVDFYRDVFGFRVVDAGGPASDDPGTDGADAVRLAPHGDDRMLLELRSDAGTHPARAARLGLYHVAYLLPDRPALGRLVRHLAERRVRLGAGDHLVSEAFYLDDPDGLGIEVYADRPRDTWRRVGDELVMASDPVDVDGLLRDAGEAPWRGIPAGTRVGHVHLHVGDLRRAQAFYGDALGFDQTVWSYPGAAFFGAGGYHHHVGTNTWAGPSASPPEADEARLLEWTIALPDEPAVERAAEALAAAGAASKREGSTVVAVDPWGTRVRLTRADAGHGTSSRTGTRASLV